MDNESKSDAAKKTQQVTPTSLADAHQFALAKARTQYDVQAQQSTPLKQRAVERLKEEEAFLRFQDKLRDVAPDRLDDAFTELGQCAHALCARPNATATLAWLGNEFAETILSKIHTVDRKQTTGREEALASEQFAQRAMALLAAGKLTRKGFEALLAGFAAGMRGVGGMGPDPADSTNQNEGIPQRVLFASAGHAASARDGLRNVVQGNAGNGALADTGRAMDRALRLSEHATTLAGLIDSLGKDDRNIGQDEDQSRQSHGQTQAPSSRAIHGSPAGKPASQEAAPRSQARSFPDHPSVQDDHDARIRDLEQELGKARKQLDQAKAGRRDSEELKSASLLAQNATIRVPAENQSQVDRLNQEVNQLRKELDALKESQATPHPEQRPSASQKDSTELESKARPQDLNPSPSSIDRERSRVLAAQMAELRKRVVLLSEQQSNGGARHEAAPSVDHTEDIQALGSRIARLEELLRERAYNRNSVENARAVSHDTTQDRPSPILRNRASSPLPESLSVQESKNSPPGNPDSTPFSSPSNSSRSSTPTDSLTSGLHQEGAGTSNVVPQITEYLAENEKSSARIEVTSPPTDSLKEPEAQEPSSTTAKLQPASLTETRAGSPAPLTDTKSQRPEGPQMKPPLKEEAQTATDASHPQPEVGQQILSAPLEADLSWLQADFDAQDRELQVASAQELANAQKQLTQDTPQTDPLSSRTEGMSPSEPALGNSGSSADPIPASASKPPLTRPESQPAPSTSGPRRSGLPRANSLPAWTNEAGAADDEVPFRPLARSKSFGINADDETDEPEDDGDSASGVPNNATGKDQGDEGTAEKRNEVTTPVPTPTGSPPTTRAARGSRERGSESSLEPFSDAAMARVKESARPPLTRAGSDPASDPSISSIPGLPRSKSLPVSTSRSRIAGDVADELEDVGNSATHMSKDAADEARDDLIDPSLTGDTHSTTNDSAGKGPISQRPANEDGTPPASPLQEPTRENPIPSAAPKQAETHGSTPDLMPPLSASLQHSQQGEAITKPESKAQESSEAALIMRIDSQAKRMSGLLMDMARPIARAIHAVKLGDSQAIDREIRGPNALNAIEKQTSDLFAERQEAVNLLSAMNEGITSAGLDTEAAQRMKQRLVEKVESFVPTIIDTALRNADRAAQSPGERLDFVNKLFTLRDHAQLTKLYPDSARFASDMLKYLEKNHNNSKSDADRWQVAYLAANQAQQTVAQHVPSDVTGKAQDDEGTALGETFMADLDSDSRPVARQVRQDVTEAGVQSVVDSNTAPIEEREQFDLVAEEIELRQQEQELTEEESRRTEVPQSITQELSLDEQLSTLALGTPLNESTAEKRKEAITPVPTPTGSPLDSQSILRQFDPLQGEPPKKLPELDDLLGSSSGGTEISPTDTRPPPESPEAGQQNQASPSLPASTNETGAADDSIQQEAPGKQEEPVASNAGSDSVAGRQALSPKAEVEAREQALAELTASGSSDPTAADVRTDPEVDPKELATAEFEKRTPRPEPLPTGQAPFEPPHRSTETEANPPSRSSSFDIETDDEQEPSTDSVEGTESPLSTDSDELPATPDVPAIGLGGGLASRLYAEKIPRSEFESRLKLSLRLLSSINFANEEVRSTEFMEFADAIKDDDLETLVEAMADVALEMIFEAAEDEEAPPLVRPRTTSTTAEEAAASGDQPPLPDGFTWLNRGQAKDAAGNLAARANSYTREVPLSASQEVQGLKARIAWRHGRQSAIKEIGAQFRASTPTPDPASPTPAMPQEVVSSQPEAIPLTSATGSASPTTLTLEPLSSGDGDRDRQTVPDGSGSRHTAAQNDTPLTRGPEGSSPVEPQLNGPISPGNRSSGPVLTVTGGRDAAPITDGSDKTQPLEQGDPPPPQFPDRLQSLLEAAPDLMREVFFSSSLKIAQNLAGVGNVKLKPLEKTISRFLDDQVAFDRDFEASLVDLIPGGAQAKPIQIEYMAKVAAIRSDVIHQAFSKAAESPEFRDRLKIRLATLEKTTRVSGIFDFCHAMRMKLESTHPGPSTGIQQGTPHTTASQATGVQASAPSSFLEEDDDAQATRATEESEALMTSLNGRTAQEKARVIWQYLGDKLIPTSGKDRDEDWLPPDREVQEALLQPIAKGLDDEAAESLILHLAHEVTRSARAQRSWEIADHALTLIAQRIVATNSEKNPIEKQRKALADAMASRPDARNARSKKIAGNIMTRLGARLLLAGAPQPRAESSSSSIDPKEFLADVAALERDTADKLAKIAENSALEKAREGDQRKTKPPGSTAESKASGGTSAIPGFVRRINEISEELSSALKTLPSDSRQWPSHMAGIFHDLSVSRSSPGGTTNTAAGELLGRTLGLGPTSPQVDETRLQDELQGVLAGSIQFASKVEDLSEFVQGLLDVAGGKHARAIARAAASATKAPLTGRPKLNAEGLVDFLIRQNNPAIIAEMRLHAAGNSLIAGALGLLDTESSDRAGRSSSTPTLRTSTRITDAARKDPASLLDAPVEEFVQDPWPERMSLVQAAMTERLAQRERDRGTWKDIGDKLAGKLNLGDLIPDHKEATWIKNHALGLEQAMNAILGQVSDDDAMAALLEGLTEDVTPNAMPTLARATLNAAEKIHGQREQRARQAVGTVFQKLYTTLSANKDMKGLPSVRTEARTLIERIQALVDSPPATDITRQARLSFSAEHSSRPKDTKG